MSTVIDVGGIKVSALNDGEVHLPPMYYPGLDFGAHPELLQADGTYHIPVGCFLIQARGRTVIVDAGRQRRGDASSRQPPTCSATPFTIRCSSMG